MIIGVVRFENSFEYTSVEQLQKDADKHCVPCDHGIYRDLATKRKRCYGWVVSRARSLLEPVPGPEVKGQIGSKEVERVVVLDQRGQCNSDFNHQACSTSPPSAKKLVGEVKKPRTGNEERTVARRMLALNLVDAKCTPNPPEDPDKTPPDSKASAEKNRGSKGRLESIGRKREVVEYYESLPFETRSEKAVLQHFHGLRLAQGKLAVWRQNYHKEMHNMIPDKLAYQWKLVPDWWCQINGIQKCSRGRDQNWWLPMDVQTALDVFLQTRIHGMGWGFECEEPMDCRAVKLALQSVQRQVHAKFREAKAEAELANKDVRSKLEAGQLTSREALETSVPLPREPRGKVSAQAARRFQSRFQWSRRQVGMTCNFLDYDDPQMERVRSEVSALIRAGEVHERLVVNYDQVWEMLCHGASSKVWKQAGTPAKSHTDYVGGEASHNHFKARMRAASGSQELLGNVETPLKKHKPDHWTAGPMHTPRNDKVRDHRIAHTVLTVSFIDGTPGLLVLAFKDGDIPHDIVARFNEEFKGSVYILVTKTATHMFDGSLTVEMWEECMTAVFRKRRAELGLTAKDRGLILCDAFTGNSSNKHGEHARREQWLANQNIKVLTSIPGGWSAHGQPNDAIHQYLRYLQRIYEQVALSVHPNPLARPKLETLTMTHVQFGQRSLKPEQVIEKDLWAWWNMPKSLMRWAWISRGFVSVEKMAEWHGVSVDDIKKEGKMTEEHRKEILELTQMPSLTPQLSIEQVQILELPLPGEKKRLWLTPETEEEGAVWQAIPSQMCLGMERELAKFRKQSSEWAVKVEKGLRSAKQREKYNYFTANVRTDMYMQNLAFRLYRTLQ